MEAKHLQIPFELRSLLTDEIRFHPSLQSRNARFYRGRRVASNPVTALLLGLAAAFASLVVGWHDLGTWAVLGVITGHSLSGSI